MNIIIVGASKVGYALTEQLSSEGHEITVIDTNTAKLQHCTSTLDVQGIVGNGTSYHVQKEAGIEKADLLIAVSDMDEINMLSCLIAKKAGNCQTIARVRNPEYYVEIGFIKEELGLSMSINPERAAASEIVNLIQFPSALEIDTFDEGRVELVRFLVTKDSVLNSLPLYDLPAIVKNVIVCAVQRDRTVIIPNGSTVVRDGDIVSVIMPKANIVEISEKLGINSKQIKNIMIAGGSSIAFYVAEMLIKSGIKVKIIEQDKLRCEDLSEQLPKAIIINADASEKEMLLEEGITQTDAFVSLTNFDEENILLSLFAGNVSRAKVITKISKITFEEVISDMPLGSIICPKNLTAEHIIRYVRAMQNSMGSSVETLYKLMDNKVEALEFIVRQNQKTENLVNIPLMNLPLISDLLVAVIIRSGKVIIPGGKDSIQIGDRVIIVTTTTGLNDLSDILRTK